MRSFAQLTTSAQVRLFWPREVAAQPKSRPTRPRRVTTKHRMLRIILGKPLRFGISEPG
jgi:hypothetical protein